MPQSQDLTVNCGGKELAKEKWVHRKMYVYLLNKVWIQNSELCLKPKLTLVHTCQNIRNPFILGIIYQAVYSAPLLTLDRF